MNKNEALNLLEIDPNSNPSESEIQSAFRKMAKKHHPDLNKNDPEAEGRFKKINEAKDYLLNPQPERHQMPGGHGFNVNIEDLFHNFGGMGFGKNQNLPIVQLPTEVVELTLNFSESVLGCDKKETINQHFHCQNCKGAGQVKQADNCKHCNGQGMKQANFSRGNMMFMNPCNNCLGSGKQINKCETCSGKGFSSKNDTVTINLPGGLVNGSILRNGNLILKINVTSDSDMKLEGTDVITVLELSLLEALKGTKKTVKTVKGEMNLKIPPKVKNQDNIVVAGYGVPQANGSHIFNVKVNYPENTDELIKILENNNVF